MYSYAIFILLADPGWLITLPVALIIEAYKSATSIHFGFLKGSKYRKEHITWNPLAERVMLAIPSSSVDRKVRLPSESSVRYSSKFSIPGQLAYVYLCILVVVDPSVSYSSRVRIGSSLYVLKNWRAKSNLSNPPLDVSFAALFVAYFTSYLFFIPFLANIVKQSPFG